MTTTDIEADLAEKQAAFDAKIDQLKHRLDGLAFRAPVGRVLHELGRGVFPILAMLITEPDKIDLEFSTTHSTLTVELRVADVDAPKVIGRGGEVIRSLQTIASVIGARRRVKVLFRLAN